MKDIRQMFYAGDGNVIIGCDFSKQEPCLLSSTCKDEKLISVFHSGLDIYSKIASMMYNCPYEDCLENYKDGTPNHEGEKRRSAAKKVVLSIMYSKGEKTLAEDINSTPEKAKEIMDATLAAYPVMRQWMEKVVNEAQERGYADNLFGRRRRWPELKLPRFSIKFSKNVDEKTKAYYSSVYNNKLKNLKWKSDIDNVIRQASQKGIIITDNSAIKSKATREIVNFYVQGCLRYDTPILTREYGLVSISELRDKHFSVWDGSNFVNASCIYSGKKQLVDVEFYGGKHLYCSLNHKLKYINTKEQSIFKSVGELLDCGNNSKMINISDVVEDFDCLVAKDFPVTMPLANNAHNYSFAFIDDHYDLGYLLGWLHGDGSIIDNKGCKWYIAENKLSLLPKLENIIKKYFKYSIKVDTKEERQKHRISNITESVTCILISSKTLATQARDLGMKKNIPSVIFKSKQAMRGFIQACFDTDGSVSKGITITFGKKDYYKKFTQDLQTILSFFCISARLSFCADRINVNILKRDTEKFCEYIGISHPQKLEKAKVVAEQYAHGTYGKKHPLYAKSVRIKNIKITNEFVDMYDIVDSDTHQFAANGIITHNSAAVVTMRAMRNIYNNPILKKYGCKLIMSIHDENLVVAPKEHAYECAKIIEQCSIDAGEGLPVPLSCDIAISEHWYGKRLTFDENHNLIPLKGG